MGLGDFLVALFALLLRFAQPRRLRLGADKLHGLYLLKQLFNV